MYAVYHAVNYEIRLTQLSNQVDASVIRTALDRSQAASCIVGNLGCVRYAHSSSLLLMVSSSLYVNHIFVTRVLSSLVFRVVLL